jgi:hypothetical protein
MARKYAVTSALTDDQMIVDILATIAFMIDSMSFIISCDEKECVIFEGNEFKAIDGAMLYALFKNMFSSLEKINYVKNRSSKPIPKKDMLRMLEIRNTVAHDAKLITNGVKYDLELDKDGEYISRTTTVKDLYDEFNTLYNKPENYNFLNGMALHFDIDYGLRDCKSSMKHD